MFKAATDGEFDRLITTEVEVIWSSATTTFRRNTAMAQLAPASGDQVNADGSTPICPTTFTGAGRLREHSVHRLKQRIRLSPRNTGTTPNPIGSQANVPYTKGMLT